MHRSTKITLIVFGATAAALLLLAGVGTICSAPDPVASSEGVAGPVNDVWIGMTRAGWLLFACGASLVLFLVVCVVRMVLGAIGEVAGGVEWLVTKVRNTWYPAPPALETVLGSKNGKPFTLQDALGSANAKIKSLESQLAEVLARTAHIEPPPAPPPPKTAEEIAAEQAEVIRALQRQLAEMQVRPKPVQAPAPAVAEVPS